MLILWLLPLSCAFLPVSAESTDKLVFRPLMHQPRIYAGAPPGIHVTTVHAYDPDRPRKKVEYNLPNVFDYQTFIVDQLSGNLTTAQPIEKSVGQTFEVMVAAVSHGSSELQHLQIAVTAFNQFPPRFEKRIYTIEMHPSTPVNTPVLQVNAIDPDPEPHNAEIYYKMDQNLTSKFFSVDAHSGELALTLPFNATAKNLHFGIFAEDGGSPKRWDYVPVYVVLKNISAPLNVQVVSVTDSNAVCCWEEPYYGQVLGYIVSYELKKSNDPKLVNVSIAFMMNNCLELHDLYDSSEYTMQVYGWNERETGQLSPPVVFRTSENWCTKVHCNQGTCESIAEYPWYHCYCPPHFSGVNCEYFDVCSTRPCGSHGHCQNISTDEYMCICIDDYIGPKCEHLNPCLENSNPCENGGTCELISNDSFECICAEGFYGRRCKKRDPCISNPCLNGGSCSQTFNDFFDCSCPPGFMGAKCEKEINHCASYPCAAGATCISYKGDYSCICSPGFYGHNCNLKSKCPAEKTPGVDGWYEWDETPHGSTMLLNCPFASSDPLSKVGNLKRRCLFINGTPIWDNIDSSDCTIKAFVNADEVAIELHNITKNPSSLNNELLEVAAQGVESIAVHATKDEKIAQDMVEVISNVMEMNDTVGEQATSETFESFRKSIDDFASNVVLNPGESVSIGTENVRIQSIDWHPEVKSEIDDDHIELTAPTDKGTVVEEAKIETTDTTINCSSTFETQSTKVTFRPTEKPKPPMFQVFVPKEALKEAHKKLEKNVRLKFVVYYNDKLFQSKTSTQPIPTSKPTPAAKSTFNDTESNEILEESPIRTPVLQISMGNVSLSNLQNPLVYILPMITKKKASCVYWKEKEKKWSINGLETTQQDDKVICRSSHMTAFSVLLDFIPDDQPNEKHDMILSIISYIGCSLSILGLLATIVTYSLFRCLNRDHPGQILLNLCVSLLMMNIVFLVGSSSLVTTPDVCAAVAVCTHYFVLSSLSWMCAEAINMRHLLVHVFATSETHFMLKRFCLAWGIPFLFVVVTVAVKFEAYHNSLDYCMLSSKDPWVYYLSFLGPCCVILAANLIIFLRVSRVICTPKLAVRNAPNQTRKVAVAQIRGSFTVMVLLGVTWVFGTMAIGEVRLIFQYLFSISNSLQGFLIFLVRCLLYPEAKNAWVYLLRTGKFKTHRGVIPPGTVSFTSNSGVKNGASPNTTLRTESTDETHSGVHKDINRDQSSNVSKISPQSLSVRQTNIEKHPNFHRSVNRPQIELCGKRLQNQDTTNKLQYRCDSIEMQRKKEKYWKNEYNTYQSQHPYPYLYEESRRNETIFSPRHSEDYSKAEYYPIKIAFPINVKFEKVKMKSKRISETNNGDRRESAGISVRDGKTLIAPSPNFQGKPKSFLAITNSNTLKDSRPRDQKARSPLEESMEDRRRSLDVTRLGLNHRLCTKRAAIIRRMRQNSNTDSISEVDEGVHSDAGSLTDTDEIPFDSYRSRIHSHSVIP